jgi:quercetin dioxygenase-like cupin family protein
MAILREEGPLMRWIMALAVAGAFGCGPRRLPAVSVGAEGVDLEAVLRAHALGPTDNIRAVEVGRTPGASVHVVQVRRGETPHRHANHDLVVTVLRGHGHLTVGASSRDMWAGDVAAIPRGTTHWYVNDGDAPSVAVAVFVPPLDAPDTIPIADVDSDGRAR